jgi:hypothetical protein
LRELLRRQPCSPPPAWRAQSLWLDKGGGQGMVEKRYELATEHAKCLDDLAAWLKVPGAPTRVAFVRFVHRM